MKRYVHELHRSPFVGDHTFIASMVVLAGVPEKSDGLLPLAPGVDRGAPVVSIAQRNSDGRTGTSVVLGCIRPSDARALAAVLIEAADYAESRDTREVPDLPAVDDMTLEDLRAEVEGGRIAYAALVSSIAALKERADQMYLTAHALREQTKTRARSER